jgi:hypothetical protein
MLSPQREDGWQGPTKEDLFLMLRQVTAIADVLTRRLADTERQLEDFKRIAGADIQMLSEENYLLQARIHNPEGPHLRQRRGET